MNINYIFKANKNTLLFILLLLMFFKLPAIEPGSESTSIGKYKTISGYIKDSQNGESLAGATIQIKETKTATSSNAYGFYSINVLPGKYTIEFSYVGFNVVSQTINVSDNLVLNIELTEAPQEIKEVIVRSETTIDKLRKPEMSVTKLETKTIKSIPALMGEVDVIKVIQMLPGVQSTSEGTSGFSVRGGGIDQNLVLLDDASIYNASHMMGFFSVFNNDVVKDIKLYKGDLPAQYGGRLSSVLDIKTKDGNNKTWNTTGGIGLISSRLTVEGPIQQDKTSILISGRRTYADIFFPFFKDKELRKSYMYFYDANIKLSSHINDKNHIFISGYTGNDHFGQKDFADMQFGNDELSIRWNHQYSGKLFSNITVFSTRYGYHMKADLGEMKYYWNSNITDYGIKIDYSLFPNPNNELKFGISTILHKINPIDAWAENDTTDSSFPDMSSNSLEHGIYLTNQQKIGDKLTIKYGLRYSVFQNIGKTTQRYFDENHNLTETKTYKSGELYNTYNDYEPRIGINFEINDKSSIKGSYSKTTQYMQLASNSNGGMPLDYWFASTPNIKPQKSHQYAIGYIRSLFGNEVEFSIELFYKKMYDVIDFKDHASLWFNENLEGDVRIGNAESYGSEVLIRKSEGKLNGWISYTYSRAFRKIEEINKGEKYPAPYDKPHVLYIVLNYELSNKITLSTNWVYASGTPITFPVGSFKYGNNLIPIYSDRNKYRMRDYHRLDISLTYKEKPSSSRIFKNRTWHNEWVISMYNAYGRHNDWIINFVNKEDNSDKKIAERTYLPFVFFPSITYNFKF